MNINSLLSGRPMFEISVSTVCAWTAPVHDENAQKTRNPAAAEPQGTSRCATPAASRTSTVSDTDCFPLRMGGSAPASIVIGIIRFVGQP